VKTRTRSFVLIALFVVLSGAWACTNWEHQTYASLSASKAVIDEAGAQYNAGKIPQTKAVKAAIEHARQVQTTAVHAFEAYAVAKVAGQPAATLEQRRQEVIAATAAVAQVVADIQKFKGASGPTSQLDQLLDPSTDWTFLEGGLQWEARYHLRKI